ncbi:DnaB-like helicase C-terminal domain-containing protein [Ktedonobacter racemifer]|uniref:DnaB domain protein helicase domain protein n=1 Tax=Ktedonobacter racemifer DSM 44963 TaxID=485913 RepID=D6TUY4_KTERA|nr:DnaB-like helicase C-terminal domain-containing protein [Ktedonobacter racemifer]EFH85310.1 DnaB domain protein helicase domain protein [Ktedonobacter racemifer DSM 44963]
MDEQRLELLRMMPYEDYLKTPEWAEKRKRALEWSQNRCQVCYTSSDLDVHHRTYERRGNEQMSDLIVLCHSCHTLFHAAQRLEHEHPPLQIGNVMQETLMDIEQVYSARVEQKEEQIATGYPDLDALLGGLSGGEVIVLAGREAIGKSTLALNIAYRVAKENQNVVYFSLQHNKTHLLHRFLSSRSHIPSQNLSTGRLVDEDWEGIEQAVNQLGSLPIWIYDNAELSPADIEASLIQLCDEEEQFSVDLVIIDDIHLLGAASSQREKRTQQLYTTLQTLKLLARKYHIPILVTSQVAQPKKPLSQIPQVADLVSPGIIEQVADVICFLHREEVYDPVTARKNIADIIVAKNVHGPLGEIPLFYAPHFFGFTELEIDNSDA